MTFVSTLRFQVYSCHVMRLTSFMAKVSYTVRMRECLNVVLSKILAWASTLCFNKWVFVQLNMVILHLHHVFHWLELCKFTLMKIVGWSSWWKDIRSRILRDSPNCLKLAILYSADISILTSALATLFKELLAIVKTRFLPISPLMF
jgi:hypothetical protein